MVGKSPFLLKTRKMRAVQSRLLRRRAKRGRTCSIDHPYKYRALVSLLANVLEENISFCQTYSLLILLNILSTSSYESHGLTAHHNAISIICYPAPNLPKNPYGCLCFDAWCSRAGWARRQAKPGWKRGHMYKTRCSPSYTLITSIRWVFTNIYGLSHEDDYEEPGRQLRTHLGEKPHSMRAVYHTSLFCIMLRIATPVYYTSSVHCILYLWIANSCVSHPRTFLTPLLVVLRMDMELIWGGADSRHHLPTLSWSH